MAYYPPLRPGIKTLSARGVGVGVTIGTGTGISNMGLTVKGIQKLTEAGRYGDGGGLYLQVTPSGGRSWILRYRRAGRERWFGLGPLRDFTLDEARQRALRARQQLRDGVDPINARKVDRDAKALEAAKHLTFKDAALQYFDSHEQKWSNAEHRRQFLSTLSEYAFPVIGKLPVAAVDTGLVLKIIEPIWQTKTQTANRVRNRIESVLGWATVRGYRSGDNPARWKGHLAEVLPAKGQIAKVEHHKAMPYTDLPAFMGRLVNHKGIDARALEFLILTASRTSEVTRARWSEFDLDAKIWMVPPERMKGRKEHRVPLTERTIAILRGLPRQGGDNGLVFIGSRKNRSLYKMALAKLLKAMGQDAITIHGFRSTFRDWAGETTAFPSDICEAALAHVVGSATQIAYQRGDLLEKRRQLMKAWAAFCHTPRRDASVTPIRRGV
jgi:integrase